MRFQVPQFIEVEDKVFGQLTVKQFIYLAAGGALGFIVWSILPIPSLIKIILILPVLAFAAALAFYKVNNKPFINIVEAAFKYYLASKLYIWKRTPKKLGSVQSENPQKTVDQYKSILVPKVSESKLKDLTWSLDIKESMYSNKNQR